MRTLHYFLLKTRSTQQFYLFYKKCQEICCKNCVKVILNDFYPRSTTTTLLSYCYESIVNIPKISYFGQIISSQFILIKKAKINFSHQKFQCIKQIGILKCHFHDFFQQITAHYFPNLKRHKRYVLFCVLYKYKISTSAL